jgi:hypothetical protein
MAAVNNEIPMVINRRLFFHVEIDFFLFEYA